MSHLQVIDTKNAIDKQYYNVSIQFDESSPNGETLAEFEEDRDIPILNKPNDWYLAITRFTINGQAIPIFIMDRIINPGDVLDPNFTPYSVTISYFNLVGPNLIRSTFKSNIIYTPRNTIATPSPPTTTSSKSINRYYYVFSYQHMIDMVNTALVTAHTAFIAAEGGASQVIVPFFKFDKQTSLFSLVLAFNYTEPLTGILDGKTQTVNRAQVCINDKLYNKCFQGIPAKFNGRGLAGGEDYCIDVIAEFGNNNAYALPGGTIPAPPGDPDFLITEQEGVTLDQWNDVRDIIFTTRSVPIYKEMVKSSLTKEGLPTFLSTITDFQPNLATALSGSSILSFFQKGPYRLINLLSPYPMRSFDFQIFWVDKLGNQIPLFITFNQEINVRFAFLRKDSFTS